MNDAILKEGYDPNNKFGMHTVEITVTQWQYFGRFQVKVGGNCKGFDIFETAVELLWEEYTECDEESDRCYGELCLKDEKGDELIVELYEDEDKLKDMVTKVEIIAFEGDKDER